VFTGKDPGAKEPAAKDAGARGETPNEGK